MQLDDEHVPPLATRLNHDKDAVVTQLVELCRDQRQGVVKLRSRMRESIFTQIMCEIQKEIKLHC